MHFARKWITIHGTISHSNLPYSMEAKKKESKRPLRGVLSPFSVRDAFGMRSERKQRFVFTYEPNRSISNAVRQGMANWFFYT